MNYAEIFDQINNERIKQGLSIASVCRKADVSQTSWENLKTAREGKGYNTHTLLAVCKVLGVEEVLFKV